MPSRVQSRRSWFIPRQAVLAGAVMLTGLMLASSDFAARRASALSPESPQVIALVAKAKQFLEIAPNKRIDDDSDEARDRTGLKALVGMVFVKTRPKGSEETIKQHPKVQEAISAIRGEISANFQGVPRANPVYSVAIAILFLVELDPVEFRPEIDSLVAYMLALQKPHGGWGYTNKNNGDLSMTQFAAVCLWVCASEGIEVDIGVWERLCNFTIRVQDVSGQWGYQAIDPGGFTKSAQDEMRHSMTAAGLGSLTLSAERCGLLKFKVAETPKDVYAPTKKSIANGRRNQSPNVDPSRMMSALTAGDNWLTNNYTISPTYWPYYYMYALERYQTIREHTIGTIEKDPQWYNDGVAYLESQQQPDGCWVGSSPTNRHPTADTCFAVLFLIRSFRKIIEKKALGAGVLKGHKGFDQIDPVAADAKKLPEDIEFVIAALEQNLDELDASVADLSKVDITGDIPQDKLNQIKQRLADLMISANTAAVREEVVHKLIAEDNLDNAPLLIQAMYDADEGVARAADVGLRKLSRKVRGAGDFQTNTLEEIQPVIDGWKAWYRTIKPDAVFGDEEPPE